MEDDEALATTSKDAQEKGAMQYQLQFVTTLSVNVDSKAEKKRNQKIIRQTVMKNFRRQQATEKAQSKGKGKKALASSAKADVGEQCNGDASSATSTFAVSRSSSTDWHENDDKSELRNEKSKSTHQELQMPHAAADPITPLGAGRIDPFQTFATDTNCHMSELIDHSISVVWPAFRPLGSEDTTNIPAAWFRASNSKALTMHSMLYGAQVHLDVLRGPRLDVNNPVRLYHKIQTMRLLKEELEHPESICLDDVILAILALSANEIETVANNVKERLESPFHSPLTSVQWLDVYGRIAHVPAHVMAMRSLVDGRGGLECIMLDGLAEVVSLSDILGATQTLSKPHWPLLGRTLKFGPLQVDEDVRFPLTHLGQSFLALRHLGLSEEMALVLQSEFDLTIIIDCHVRGTNTIKDFTSFIDRRNSVQHRLMSLPSGGELPHGEVKSVALYEAIRYTMIAYSAAVTFPLPPLTGIFHQLASVLQTLLENSKADPCWRHSPRTLLWILVLGGIAASETPERTWFVRNMRVVAKVLRISKWEEVTAIMEGYLWLDSACDTGGRILWAEATGVSQ